MALYKLGPNGSIFKPSANMSIPLDPKNSDYIDYQNWLAAGNTPDPVDPPPIIYTANQNLVPSRVRTTNATPTELARFAVPINTEFTAVLRVRGITDDLANLRNIQATVVVGRASGNVTIIPTRVGAAVATIGPDHAFGTGGSWGPGSIPVSIAVDNSGAHREVVVSVTGAAATNINWLLTGQFETFTPLGA